MSHSVLAVGIEPELSKFLTDYGFAVTAPRQASLDCVCSVLAQENCNALLVGAETYFHAEAVERLRAEGHTLAIVRLEKGPRTRAWSYRCARFIECGGDNVILTPCINIEVARCLELAIRHAEIPERDVIKFTNGTSTLEIDDWSKLIKVDGKTVPFTAYEYEMLKVLVTTKGPVSLVDLAGKARQDEMTRLDSNLFCVFISRIRKKIGQAVTIATVRGVGYRLLTPTS